jgi:hypothetical protein
MDMSLPRIVVGIKSPLFFAFTVDYTVFLHGIWGWRYINRCQGAGGGRQENTESLTDVNDSGERVRPTHLHLEQ